MTDPVRRVTDLHVQVVGERDGPPPHQRVVLIDWRRRTEVASLTPQEALWLACQLRDEAYRAGADLLPR